MAEHSWWESIRFKGEQFYSEIERMVQEGNVRRIVIKQGTRVIAEFPLTVGRCRGDACTCAGGYWRHRGSSVGVYHRS